MSRYLVRLIGLCLLFALATPAIAQGPTLNVTSPTDGATINGATVTVAFTVTGLKLVPTTVPIPEAGKRPDANRPGEGHVHLKLDLQPLVVWERGEPYTFDNVPAGEHQLVVELVNNDHSSLTPPVRQQLRFRNAIVMPPTGASSPDYRSILLIAVIAVALALGGLMLHRKHRYMA